MSTVISKESFAADPAPGVAVGEIRLVQSEAEVAACHPVMCQLRPYLATAGELVERWRELTPGGYRLAAVWMPDGRPVALAGYRFTDNLIHRRHVYVDDLVTDEGVRGQGHGAALLRYMGAEARAAGCGRLVLDAALANAAGHRFYNREGLLTVGLHFMMKLDG